jgi:iron complex outermembrane recepter protein
MSTRLASPSFLSQTVVNSSARSRGNKLPAPEILITFVRWTCSIVFSLPAIQAAEPNAGSAGGVSGRVRNAVSGLYLSNARIAVQGTDAITFTDNSGAYNLVGLKGGSAVLEVSYTDLDVRAVPVVVVPGQVVRQDVELTSLARYGESSAATKLDPYIVGANREADAEALAINEQRYAPNIKNVVATDAMGDMVGGSAGEFLKYLPGLTANYDSTEVLSVSIRGIGGSMTSVESDGLEQASASHSPSRTMNLIPMAINQVSRIDVTKVPVPSSPADSLAGSINMISKTAFERNGDELRYGLHLTGNLLALDLKRTPHPFWDNKTYKILPGFDFDYTKLLTKNFGVTLTAMQASSHTELTYTNLTWNTGGTATGASISQPYLQTVQLFGSRRLRFRSLYGIRSDWRIAPHSVLTFGARFSKGISARNGRNTLTFNAGTDGNPTPATGTRMSFGPDYTEGATGRGTVTLAGTGQWGNYDGTINMDVHYRFDNGTWKVNASYNYSDSSARLEPTNTFTSINSVIKVPNRVSFHNIGQSITPGTIQIFDNANQEIDVLDINNYRMTTAGRGANTRNQHMARFGKIDIGRRLGIFSFPATLQTGVLRRIKSRDRRTDIGGTYNFAGVDPSPVPYLGRNFSTIDFISFPDVPALSAFRGHEAFVANPGILTQTTAQVVSGEVARLNASENAKEVVTAYYGQADARLFKSRLHIVTGVRYERTDLEGQGLLFDPNLVFMRNADGIFSRNAQGARIRRPEAGAAGSLEEAHFVRKERGYMAERTYDGYYPSLHLSYNITEEFIGRLAYAKTYGRPNFTSIIPNATINEADLDQDQLDDPDTIKGTITVRNTGLKPWSAHNYDLSFEYYTKQGGLFSTGVFLKEITDFFGTAVRVATPAMLEEIGLESRYEGWNLNTMFNSGDAKISGVEFNARQSLRQLGHWGRYFTVFANATRLRLEGNPFASFDGFVPKSASWGFSYNWRRITVMPKWTYRGLVKEAAMPAFGPDGFEYTRGFTIMDLNVVYRLKRDLSLNCSINNVFNAFNDRLMRYGSQTPKYAYAVRMGEYGPAFSIGVKGRF